MLETMGDSAQRPTHTPGLNAEATAPKPGAAADDAPASTPVQPQPNDLPGASEPLLQLAANGINAAVPAGTAFPAPEEAPDPQTAGTKSADASRPTIATPAPAKSDSDDDPLLLLLQQAGVPITAPTPKAADGAEPAKAGKKDKKVDCASDASPKAQDGDASGKTVLPVAPELPQAAASAVAPGMPVAAVVPATTLPAADPSASAPAGDAAQGVPVTTTLSRPASPAFQPGAPRPPSPADAKPAKDDDKADTPPASDTSEPQGILPPSDKPNPVAATVRKNDTAPAPQHRSATELQAALSDSRPANQDSLLDPATFGATSGTAAAAGVSHASAAAGASGSTAASAAQNQIQLQQSVPLSGVPVLIASRALAGDKYFEIRLDPPELGRIEVRLKLDRDGQISSHVIADRSDTLTLLRRDGTGLERALQDAGFKTAGDGLQFSLRDQSGHGQQDSRPAPQPLAADQDTTTRLDAIPTTYMRYSGRAGGLDIRV